VGRGPNPAVREANCRSELGSGYDPLTFTSDIVNATAIGRTGGNPGLQNETSESWTWGLTWEPEYVEGLLVTFDMINIELVDAIASLGLTQLMTSCYDATDFPAPTSCGAFTRDGSGQVVDFLTGQTNSDSFRYKSADTFVRYRWNMEELGNFQIASRWTHLIHRSNSVNGEAAFNNIGTYTDPKNSGTFDVTWDKDNWRVFWRVLWQERADLDPQFQNEYQLPNGDLVDSTASRQIHNATVSYILPEEYSVGEETVVQLTVNNVLGHQPSFLSQTAGHFGFAELFGRNWTLSVRMSL
jgi:hypothetical protein